MPKNNELSSKDLEKRIDLLIKRFEEQKGIIDSYVKREREWKKDKVLLNAVTIHLDYKFLTLNQLKEINLSNSKAFVYTCNDPDEITTLWDAGLSGVITDDPLKFI